MAIGQHLAELAAAVAQQPAGGRVALQRQRDQVAQVADLVAGLAGAGDQRPAAGERLEAAGGAAAARQARGGVDLGVPDLAGGAEVAAEHPAVGDDAEAEAGGGLDDQHVVERGGAAEQLGAGEHVGVVADEERRVGDLVEVRRQLDAVPAGHHRRADAEPAHASRGCRAGSGRCRAPGGVRRPSSRAASRSAICGISSSGPTPTSWSRESEAISSPSRSITASWLRERPIATATHDAGVLVEDQRAGRAAAGRGELLAEQQQPGRGQRADPGGDGGAGQAGEGAQLRAGAGPAAADQVEQLAGGRRGGALARFGPRHGGAGRGLRHGREHNVHLL